MEPAIDEAKASLRAKVRAVLDQLSPTARETQARQAGERLARQPLYQRATSILFFAPLPDELDIWPLVIAAGKAGKVVALPRFESRTGSYVACQVSRLEKDLQTGRFGIREPAAHCADLRLNRLDLILVPGVAFDLLGRRLGRGRGFYDRLLEAVHGTTCGVAFDGQILSEIPVAPHDVRVNCIITPTRWIEP